MLKTYKKIRVIVLMGLLWGITELIAGYFLHLCKMPIAGSFLLPIGIFCMTHVYNLTKSIIYASSISIIAALVKLLTFLFIPASSIYIVINPVMAILLEGVIITISISLLDKKIFSKTAYTTIFHFFSFFLSIIYYKICFIAFQVILKAEEGTPAIGNLSISENLGFLIQETAISVIIIVLFLYFRYFSSYKTVSNPQE